MATPVSGTISMLNMRTEITRGTGAISMSEVRNRYGSAGAISFSELYKCEGYIVNCSTFRSKFVSFDGWQPGTGNVEPNESNNRLFIVTNCYVGTTSTSPAGVGSTNTAIAIAANNSAFNNGNAVAVSWKATDVTRVVTANVSRPITGRVSNSAVSAVYANATMPNAGAVHCLIKF